MGPFRSSRLYLLRPSEHVSAKVASKQQDQKDHYVQTPRRAVLPPDSPMMIRDYTPRGKKWTPATVQKQTGPVSFKCITPDGNVVKRHQDQIHRRSLQSPASPTELPTSSPTPTQVEAPTAESSGIPEVAAPPVSQHPETPVRRSTRIKRPVEKLNL